MNTKHLLTGICFYLFFQLWSPSTTAQVDTLSFDELLRLKVEDMYQLSEEDVLNTIVTIASKKAESIFDAPLSTSVISREDLLRSGVTSIGEALRLVPGLVVFEQTNGNYDIHLRGGGNVQRNTIFSRSANTTTLVMIDNRPIYNYYQGGTFWETIPIDLQDIERIEVVRGAASALYGPNAASGVINIITREIQKDGNYVVANGQQGSDNTTLSNLAIGYRPNAKFNAIVSVNSQLRDRDQETYYAYDPTNGYVPRDSLATTTPAEVYPDATLAMKRYGVNGFLSYHPNQKISLDFDLGYQDSEVQKVYSENFLSPLNTSRSESGYADLKFQLADFYAQVGYQRGSQREGLDSFVGLQWDFNTLDANAEYNFDINNDLSIQPGINFRRAVYDDTPYYDESTLIGFLNGSRSLSTIAAYVRGDWSFWEDKMRIIGGVRVDKFNFPDEPYFSYQAALTYKPSEKNLFRFVAASANRNSSIIDTHVNRVLPLGADTQLEVIGNTNLELLTSQLLELGYRRKLNSYWWLNLEVFAEFEKNFSDFIEGPSRASGTTTIRSQVTTNTPLETREYGATLEMNFAYRNLQARGFATYNRTRLKNASLFPNTADAPALQSNNNDPSQFNLNSGQGTTITHEGSPDWYGGFMVNYNFKNKVNLNLNSYFFTGQNYFYFLNAFLNDGSSGLGSVPGKFLLNLKASYSPIPIFSVYFNIRNLTNSRSIEYFNVDTINLKYLFGIHVGL